MKKSLKVLEAKSVLSINKIKGGETSPPKPKQETTTLGEISAVANLGR